MIKIILNNLKEETMPTEIQERLFIKDTDNATKLIVYHNGLDIILIEDDDYMNNPNGLFLEINEDDWEEIKSFIDKQFKDAN